jgi:hypothetical protein
MADVGGELVSATGDSTDEVCGFGFGLECLAEAENLLGEVGFLNESVLPDGFEKLLFGDEATRIAREVEENLEGFWSEQNFRFFEIKRVV